MPHILLIEDDRWLAELYTATLKQQKSYKVSTAHSAADGLAFIGAKEGVDLVILDMLLSDFNGVEFLHEVASYDDINKTPFIVFSSIFEHDFQMHPERWKQYGVIDYLYKPTTKPDDLLSRVKKYFAKSKTGSKV